MEGIGSFQILISHSPRAFSPVTVGPLFCVNRFNGLLTLQNPSIDAISDEELKRIRRETRRTAE